MKQMRCLLILATCAFISLASCFDEVISTSEGHRELQTDLHQQVNRGLEEKEDGEDGEDKEDNNDDNKAYLLIPFVAIFMLLDSGLTYCTDRKYLNYSYRYLKWSK